MGAIGTGIARGAYETAMEYARKKKVGGELLINHQWAQIILTDMYRNVNMSRTIYMESAYTDMLQRPVQAPGQKADPVLSRHHAAVVLHADIAGAEPGARHPATSENTTTTGTPTSERDASSGWASIAKYTCTDMGVINANLALDLMGVDGLRHDHGAEKCYRDVKLTQIYESTNQVNQMNLFCCLVGNHMPEVEFFK